jgi:esterase/lipase
VVFLKWHNKFSFYCNSRVQYLEQELLSVRSKEHEETATLEKAIEQVEDNLKRTTVSRS